MSLRTRILVAALLLLGVSAAGVVIIVGNLHAIINNQRLIVFKDETFHEQERARALIMSSQVLLYQHQAGYTRDIDRLIDDIAVFEEILLSIVPHYRQHLREEDCTSCHRDAQVQIDHLDERVHAILVDLERFRESVSIIITTNDREARLLQHGAATARGQRMIASLQEINTNAAHMVAQLRVRNERLLRRSVLDIEITLFVVGLIFTVTLAYGLVASHRLFVSLVRGTESLTRDEFTHRLALANRADEFGLLAGRFNLMAEHLQERDEQIRRKTEQIEDANRQLHELNETLEEKVEARTHDLQATLEQVRQTSVALEDSRRRLEVANQELTRANQAKANFLSIVSHELKTPLSVINGFLSLILDERYQSDPRQLREAVQISKRRGEQLSRMIDELIDLSRLDARSMVLHVEETDTAALLRELAAEFAEETRRRGLRLELHLPEAPPTVPCDADKMRQVFTNLLANAIKFSPDGGRIDLELEVRADEIVYCCRDTGIGIPATEVEKVFEKFYQVDSTATRRFGGAGLGLSIVREIMLLHGGRAWAESSPGHGSTFFVSLPRHPRTAASAALPEAAAAQAAGDAQPAGAPPA
ncbi:MAG TPA: ATP-binding protein [bacterium]